MRYGTEMIDISNVGSTITLKNKNEIVIRKETVNFQLDYHDHDYIEIAYIDSGKGLHEIENGIALPVEKGNLIFMNTIVAHRFSAGPENPLIVYNCIFDPMVLYEDLVEKDDFINNIFQHLFDAGEKPNKFGNYIILTDFFKVENIFHEMYREYKEKPKAYRKLNQANLVKLLIMIFRSVEKKSLFNSDGYYKTVIENSISFMNENLGSVITSEMLARRVYLSTSHFGRIFKDYTGEAPLQYLTNIRLSKAAQLLVSTRLPVSKIMQSVGYSDIKHFYSLFHAKYDMTPNSYRKEALIKTLDGK